MNHPTPPPPEQLIVGLQQWARFFEHASEHDDRAAPIAHLAKTVASDALQLFARAEGLIEEVAA